MNAIDRPAVRGYGSELVGDLAARFAARAPEFDRTGDFPHANFRDLADAGLLRLTVARDGGGLGAGLAETMAIVEGIAAGDASTALVLAMHYVNHASIARGHRWPAHIADRLVASTQSGIALVNTLQVEPEAGSPSYGSLPRTVARRIGDNWRITGRKRFVTGVPALAWLIVLAVTDEAEPRLGSFVVPRQAPGVSVIETWNTLGMRATASHDVVLDDVAIPITDAFELSPAADGLRRDEFTGAWFMALIGAVYHGVARAARRFVVDFARDFSPGGLGAPLASVPRIRDEIGAIELLLAVSDRLLQSLGRDVDEGRVSASAASIVRHTVIENAVQVTTLALGIAGQHGLSRDNPLERHHRDALSGRAHAPGGHLIRQAAAAAALAVR